jgi:hypothetical protein
MRAPLLLALCAAAALLHAEAAVAPDAAQTAWTCSGARRGASGLAVAAARGWARVGRGARAGARGAAAQAAGRQYRCAACPTGPRAAAARPHRAAPHAVRPTPSGTRRAARRRRARARARPPPPTAPAPAVSRPAQPFPAAPRAGSNPYVKPVVGAVLVNGRKQYIPTTGPNLKPGQAGGYKITINGQVGSAAAAPRSATQRRRARVRRR